MILHFSLLSSFACLCLALFTIWYARHKCEAARRLIEKYERRYGQEWVEERIRLVALEDVQTAAWRYLRDIPLRTINRDPELKRLLDAVFVALKTPMPVRVRTEVRAKPFDFEAIR